MASLCLPLQMLATNDILGNITGTRRSLPLDLPSELKKPLLWEVPSADSRPKTDSFDEPPYKIVKIDGKGEGLVATRDLAPGDFITSEKVQLKWHSSEQSFYRLEWMLSRLSEEDRNAFYNLHNCYTKEELGCPEELLPPDIIGKWDTNCFAIQDGYKILLLGPITKVNHSCRPNVSHEYRAETDTMTLVAQDYISIGQELSITYVDLFQDRFHRRWHTIMSWGFLCECQACNLTGEELQLSDERRTRIANISDVELPRQKTCPQQRIRLLKESLELCMAEGLYGAMHTFSRECVKLCAELELEEDVSAWATIAAEHIRIARGEDDESYRLMQRCISQPWLYRQEMLKENSWVERTFKLAGAYVCGLF